MRGLLAFLDRRGTAFNVGLAVALLALIGLGDTVLPKQVSFSYLYLVPTGICAWYAGRRAAVAMAVACIVVWTVSDFHTAGGIYPNPVLPLWNGAIRFSFYLIMALLLVELRRSLQHEKELARTDFLTGLANPRWFYEVCETEARRSRRYQRPMTLVYIDVDDFKSVNDRFGHRGGDNLLRTVAETIRATIRHTDFAARWGGDEFVILLPETDSDQSAVVVDKLRAQLLAGVLARGWPVTFSLGVGTLRRPEGSVEDFVARADALMYLAKRQGKNSVSYQVWSAPSERTA
jgi:diguanylate cyclase (GGDEF)-like protein